MFIYISVRILNQINVSRSKVLCIIFICYIKLTHIICSMNKYMKLRIIKDWSICLILECLLQKIYIIKNIIYITQSYIIMTFIHCLYYKINNNVYKCHLFLILMNEAMIKISYQRRTFDWISVHWFMSLNAEKVFKYRKQSTS